MLIKKKKLINFFFLTFIFLILLIFPAKDLAGLTIISLVVFLTLIALKNHPSLGFFMIVALAIRIYIICIGSIFVLPDSVGDASEFEKIAWEWSKDGFFTALSHYTGPNSKFISWIIALFYSILGRSILLAQSLSLFFGMASIFLGWLLTKKLWDSYSANKAGWLFALYPTLALYSTLILREVYITFFFLLALHGIVNWTKNGDLKSIFLTAFGFIGATFFHGAMFLGLIVFFIIIGLNSFTILFRSLLRMRINLRSLIIFASILIFGIIIMVNKISIPKLGNLNESFDISIRLDMLSNTMTGDASYPIWLKINSPIEFIYKGPIRMIYFIASPFPWDITKPKHILGAFEGFFFTLMVYLIWCNRKAIWENKAMRIIIIILIVYIFIFAIGVGNFGTTTRHRSKFIMVLISIAAPYITNFRIGKNKSL